MMTEYESKMQTAIQWVIKEVKEGNKFKNHKQKLIHFRDTINYIDKCMIEGDLEFARKLSTILIADLLKWQVENL
jgi:hypothetical protein